MYTRAILAIVTFEVEDVITTSDLAQPQPPVAPPHPEEADLQ